jgi:hypothetical protein
MLFSIIFGLYTKMEEMKQSQNHGFKFEGMVRENVFDLQPNSNDTNIHDIPCRENKFTPLKI